MEQSTQPLLGISSNHPLGLGITWQNTLKVSDLISLVDQNHVSLPGIFPPAGYTKIVTEAALKLCAPGVLQELKVDDFFVQNDIHLGNEQDQLCIELELQPTGTHERDGKRTDFVNFRIRSKKDGTSSRGSMQLNALGCLRLTSSNHQSRQIDESTIEPKPQILKTLPMSYGQSGFWFLSQLVGDPTFFNVTLRFLITAKHPLDVQEFKKNVRDMAQQHEGLRTAFFADPTSNEPVQSILSESPLHLETKHITSPTQIQPEIDAITNSIYDLSQGKTVRLTLLSESPTRHHLLVGYHHINTDGLSVVAITDYLRLAYGRDQKPPPPSLQQNQFASSQRKRLATGHYAKSISYWKKEFKNLPDILPILPLSPNNQAALKSSRPTTRTTYRNITATTKLSPKTATKLLKLKNQGLIQSPFVFYLTVFQILLSRLADLNDIVIGVPIGNRRDDLDPGSTESIGIFLNPIALRLETDLSNTFSTLLQQNQKKFSEGLKHSAVPFDVVLDEVGAPRNFSYSPLFQAFFNYIPVTEDREFGKDGIMHNEEFDIGETIYDVMLAIVGSEEGSSLSIMLQRELYTEEEAGVLLDSFVRLVEGFVENFGMRGCEIGFWGREEVDRALWLGRGVELDMDFGGLLEQIEGFAENKGREVALRDGARGERVVSWKEMMDRSEKIAKVLYGKVKGGEKARVGVLQEPTLDWVCSMLGIWKFGGSYVPLEVTQGAGRLRSIVKDAELVAVLVHGETRELCEEVFAGEETVVVDIDEVETTDTTTTNFYRPKPKDEALVLYTSGSTGKPKGISMPHRMIANTINGFLHTFPMEPQIVLQQIPLSFDASWWAALVGLATGGSLVIAGKDERRDPAALTSLIASEGITLTFAVPSEGMSWLEHGIDHHLLRQSNWKFHITAGEPVGRNLVEMIRRVDKSNLRLLNAYGPAETIIPTVYEIPYRDDEFLKSEEPIPIGKVLPNYNVYVVDQNNHPLPVGIPGQIAIGGAGVALGYIGQPEMTATRFPKDSLASSRALANGWTQAHLSGDRGYIREDGTFVMLGRMNDDTQVKLRGQRFELREVEAALVAAGKGDILEAVCHIRQDENRKDDASAAFLVAHVVMKSGIFDPDNRLREVSSQLTTLPLYMRPSVIFPLSSIPLSHHGKVDRKLLSKTPLRRESREPVEGNPSPVRETEMEAIWREVLVNIVSQDQRLDHNSDFFLVGGNSLLLINVKNRIKERTGKDIPLVSLFQANTLGKMAAAVSLTADTSIPVSTPKTLANKTSSTQAKMKQIWLSVLKDIINDPNSIGPASDFFLLGGNSLLLIRVQRELNNQFDLLLPIARMFESSTLDKMSILLDETLSTQPKPQPLPPQPTTTTTIPPGPINWQQETTFNSPVPESYLTALQTAKTHPSPPNPPLTIILTGSTGFLGRQILSSLLSNPQISQIHCLAVRTPSKFPFPPHPKITIHPGDLLKPSFPSKIFSSPNLHIIHSAADLSFLKPYHTLRTTNHLSTKTLIDCTIKNATTLPQFHFISTAGLTQLLSESEDLYEQSLPISFSSNPEAILDNKGLTGYILTKLCSEKYLESTHEQTSLPITIHRPAHIIGEEPSQLDMIHNLLYYSEKMGAVPDLSALFTREYQLQLVNVQNLAGNIVEDMLEQQSCPEFGIRYLNHCGEEKDWIKLGDLERYVNEGEVGIVELEEWVERGKKFGMPEEIRMYLGGLVGEDGRRWMHPKLKKGRKAGMEYGPWKRVGRL